MPDRRTSVKRLLRVAAERYKTDDPRFDEVVDILLDMVEGKVLSEERGHRLFELCGKKEAVRA